jgi:gamma-glutamylcyclotransferase (GGCT)/AIG2-like uncharacterized protein YtfP
MPYTFSMKQDSLFAYGTLRHPAVITHVIGRVPEREEADLDGYGRYRVRGQDFPGIYPESGAQIDGTLFQRITAEEWERLDAYESNLYKRKEVKVKLANGKSVLAFAYVLPPANESVCTEESWDLNRYRPTNL